MKVCRPFALLVLVLAACRSVGPSPEAMVIWRPTGPCVLRTPTGGADSLLIGIVVDRETNCPLPHARVELLHGQSALSTDDRGVFRIALPFAGPHEIRVGKVCWQRRVVSIEHLPPEPLVIPLERLLCTI